jgi:1,4-alpha-glucan branching enzyme
MLEKKASRENGTTEVTFVLPAEVEGEVVYVVGDFNNWQKTHPMTRQEGGLWKLAIEMEPGCDCQFRYLVDDQQWLNDPEADDYVPNPYGDHNCVVKT